MGNPKSNSPARRSFERTAKVRKKLTVSKTLPVASGHAPSKTAPKARPGVSEKTAKGFTVAPRPVKALLKGYQDAFAKSRAAGKAVSFRVKVDPSGKTVLTQFEEVSTTPESDLDLALLAARERGRLRAAEILDGRDMLNADDFAKLIGTTRVTVNAKRQSGQMLGIDGAKRGYRYPTWQLDAEGKPFAQLGVLHERLGGPWAVYRFLVQSHGELDGLTGRQALKLGRVGAVLAAAESVARDFR